MTQNVLPHQINAGAHEHCHGAKRRGTVSHAPLINVARAQSNVTAAIQRLSVICTVHCNITSVRLRLCLSIVVYY